MNVLSVNEAIDRVLDLNGQHVSIVGVLSLEFEATELIHQCKAERRERPAPGGAYESSIWVDFDFSLLKMDERQLAQFDSRHVVVHGLLSAPDPSFRDSVLAGCGHFSMWQAEVRVTWIEKLEQSFQDLGG